MSKATEGWSTPPRRVWWILEDLGDGIGKARLSMIGHQPDIDPPYTDICEYVPADEKRGREPELPNFDSNIMFGFDEKRGHLLVTLDKATGPNQGTTTIYRVTRDQVQSLIGIINGMGLQWP